MVLLYLVVHQEYQAMTDQIQYFLQSHQLVVVKAEQVADQDPLVVTVVLVVALVAVLEEQQAVLEILHL